MISIGVLTGGPEETFFLEVVRPFMKYCRLDREGIEQEAEVNVVFDLPGSLHTPVFVGVIPDKFSKAKKTQMVKVAVEQEWMDLQDIVKVQNYIHGVTDEALGVAKSQFDKKGINYDIQNDRKVIDNWLNEKKM